MEREKLHLATLTALFHDIGKFYQRTQDNPRKRKHYQFSADFLKEKREKIKRLFNLTDEEFEALKKAVERHHGRLTPSEPLPFIVQSADWLSSGLDRVSIDEEAFVEGKNPEDDKGIYKLLVSPFALIKIKQKDKAYHPCITHLKEERTWGYKFKELTSENLFPVKEGEYPIEERKRDYKELWKKFLREFDELPESGDFNFRFETLRALFLKYMWCVPSYTYAKKRIALPDVSLAHHLLTSAAIATALWKYEESKGFDPKSLKSKDVEKFIFLSVDFSGIQSFIFSPPKDTKKWAAKILRARSFIVSLALETVVNRLLEAFGVNASSLLMNAGGKAWLLLPNLSDAEDRIEEVRKEVVEALLSSEKNFFGEVKLKIAYLELPPRRLHLKNFGKIVEELTQKEAEAKFRLFKPEDFSKLIISGYCGRVSEGDESKKLCPVCGKAPASEELYGEKVCSLCKYLIELGEKLPKSDYAKVSFKSSSYFPLPEVELFKCDLEEKLKELKEGEKIYSFTTKTSRPLPLKPLENAVPIYDKEKERDELKELVEKCYEGEKAQEFVGKPKNFCHIGLYALKKSEGSFCGRPFLGVLKADVDNLGYIFAKGFVRAPESDGDEECRGSIHSLSRLLQLSWFLDFFFSEVVREKIVKEKFENIYSVFSGGDDLFFIGPWEDVLKFEGALREEFKEFTCRNDSFTLSVGIAVVKPNLPIYAFAEEAEEALERSKREGKNSTTLFDRRVDYREFTLKELLEVADEIVKRAGDCADARKISNSFLYKLLTLSEMANNEGKSVKNLLWRAYLRYLTSRNFKKEDAEEFFKEFEKWIRKYSENISEEEKKGKDNLFYIPLAIAIYRRRRYESSAQ